METIGAAMEIDKYMQTLQEEISEIKTLLEKWRSSLDEGDTWATGLLEMCLFRRMQVLRAQSYVEGVE
jgi:hypothetical protein